MIVIMGFKHVGKSSIGRALACAMNMDFLDLDEVIEEKHKLSPRELVKKHGEETFRKLERQSLIDLLNAESFDGVLSLGGGTPIHSADILKEHVCIHLNADAADVFQWIKESGFPPFFSEENPRQSFEKLWQERMPHYENLATYNIYNNGNLEQIISQLKSLLK